TRPTSHLSPPDASDASDGLSDSRGLSGSGRAAGSSGSAGSSASISARAAATEAVIERVVQATLDDLADRAARSNAPASVQDEDEAPAAAADQADPDVHLLLMTAQLLRDVDVPAEARLAAMEKAEVRRALAARPVRELLTESERYPLRVDRARALFGSWYEMFPRSEGAQVDPTGATPPVSGTLRTAAERLPGIAAMGFDVVYLPPVHPIGTAFRTGPNNTTTAGPWDVGSPWAIGSPDGGHDSIHPDLGTFADFDYFVDRAGKLGMEVALDFALQCSPDHPWVLKHPDWFAHRADGTIAYAENPPKKYQDIYPLDFDGPGVLPAILEECERVLRLWMG